MLLHVLAGACILRFAYPRTRPEQHARLMGWWSRKLLAILAVELHVSDGAGASLAGPVMLVANHVSWLDIFAISATRPARFIAKREIRDWPLVGWIVERAGTLFLRREGRRDLARMAEEVHAALAQRDRVGLFPEGITTQGERLLKFHSSLFEPAIRNDASVVPTALRYTRPDGTPCVEASFAGDITFMQSFASIVRQRRIVVHVDFLAPIEAAGRDRRSLALEAHARIATRLGLTADTAPRTAPDPPAAAP
jgi:1-acyl-sn-glycerol-3-phosphate acyltransferase